MPGPAPSHAVNERGRCIFFDRRIAIGARRRYRWLHVAWGLSSLNVTGLNVSFDQLLSPSPSSSIALPFSLFDDADFEVVFDEAGDGAERVSGVQITSLSPRRPFRSHVQNPISSLGFPVGQTNKINTY
jgi:hypothetical protein